jgi:hypothetical protein
MHSGIQPRLNFDVHRQGKRTLKAVFLIFVAVLAVSAYAEPSAPTAKQLSDWVVFSNPVNLMAEKDRTGDLQVIGKPIWVYIYRSPRETLHAYVIGLYQAGTLYGKDRDEVENTIREIVAHPDQKSRKSGERSRRLDQIEKHVRLETRWTGRKVYFDVFSPLAGADAYQVFTTIGKYDLLLVQSEDPDNARSRNKALKNPSVPTKDLSTIFKQLEKYIAAAK